MKLDEAFKMEIVLMLRCSKGGQRTYFETMLSHLQPCKVVPCSKVFHLKDRRWIQKMVKAKQCYRNAYKVCEHFADRETKPEYVEGKVLVCGLPIDHAWVKVGDYYIDPTFEFALCKDVKKERYAALQTFPLWLVRDYQLQTQVYGDIYRRWLTEQIFDKRETKRHREFSERQRAATTNVEVNEFRDKKVHKIRNLTMTKLVETEQQDYKPVL